MNIPVKKPIEEKARRGRPPGISARDTRLRLLRSAAQEFSQAEYSNVSLEAIAGNVGLTPAAIYNHFSSKDDLFFATITHLMKTNVRAIETAIQSETDWRSMLRAVIDLIRRDETGWFRYPLLTSAAQLKLLQEPQQSAEILSLREVFLSHFVAIVERGIVGDDLSRSLAVKPTAELLMALVFNGIGAAMIHSSSQVEIEQLTDAFEALLKLVPQQTAD